MNTVVLTSLHLSMIIAVRIRDSEASCRQICDEPQNVICSNEATCAVQYNNVPLIGTGTPLLLPQSISLKAKCHQRNIGNGTTHHVGIEMIWKMNGRNIGPDGVEEFLITITDISQLSITTEAFVLVRPNNTMTTSGTVTFIYYYAGADDENGPEINANGAYQITLQSVPVLLKDGHSWPQKVRESIRIPKYFVVEDCANDTITEMTPVNNDVHKWQILTMVLGLICLIVGTVALAAFSWKRRKDAHNAYIASKEHRILILLNMDDKADVAKQTNWTATALSRITKMGDVTVKYNRWEMNEILEKGIARWLDEKVTWANKIIISSTPDELRNESTAQVFEQVLENVMLQHMSIDVEFKQVFIIHFDDRKKYSDCPFMKDDKYPKFRLDEDWVSLCRSIHGCFNNEQEPLHIGNAV